MRVWFAIYMCAIPNVTKLIIYGLKVETVFIVIYMCAISFSMTDADHILKFDRVYFIWVCRTARPLSLYQLYIPANESIVSFLFIIKTAQIVVMHIS